MFIWGRHTEGGFSAKLDAVGKSVEMSSGVMVADMLEGTKFALGATMAVAEERFRRLVGWRSWGSFTRMISCWGTGWRAQGTGCAAGDARDPADGAGYAFWVSFRNQLRWMQSTRRSRPWGIWGRGLTFAMPFGVLGCCGGC